MKLLHEERDGGLVILFRELAATKNVQQLGDIRSNKKMPFGIPPTLANVEIAEKAFRRYIIAVITDRIDWYDASAMAGRDVDVLVQDFDPTMLFPVHRGDDIPDEVYDVCQRLMEDYRTC